MSDLDQLIKDLSDNANDKLMRWESDMLDRFEAAGVSAREAVNALFSIVGVRAARLGVVAQFSESDFLKVMKIAYRFEAEIVKQNEPARKEHEK